MILVIAGTKDGRELAQTIAAAGETVMVSVVSDYGRELTGISPANVWTGALDTFGMAALIRKRDIDLIIDASHPYAVEVSRNAIAACHTTGVEYLRFERQAVPLPDYDKLYVVASAAEAARMAAKLGQVIFLTTGSRTLKTFKQEPLLCEHRIIVRVLPDAKVLAECQGLGFCPADIIAMQGPFSLNLNAAMFKEVQADVVITKNSGITGGVDAKLQAAMDLGLVVIIIDRPSVEYPQIVNKLEDVLAVLKNRTIR